MAVPIDGTERVSSIPGTSSRPEVGDCHPPADVSAANDSTRRSNSASGSSPREVSRSPANAAAANAEVQPPVRNQRRRLPPAPVRAPPDSTCSEGIVPASRSARSIIARKSGTLPEDPWTLRRSWNRSRIRSSSCELLKWFSAGFPLEKKRFQPLLSPVIMYPSRAE